MAETKRKKSLWNFIDNLQGDKVVWMIVLLLILISIVAIFSSTSQLADSNTTRLNILYDQMLFVTIGLVCIIVCYNIKNIRVFSILSQFGYVVSIIPLIILAGHMKIGPIHAEYINHAYRTIGIGSKVSIQVFEIVKVAMVMYLSWAVTAYKNNELVIANLLSKKYPAFKKPVVKQIMYLYIPIFSVALCCMVGSLSTTLFVGGIMFITILVGGIKIKELILPVAAAFVALGLCIGINTICINTGGKAPFPHLSSALARFDKKRGESDYEIVMTGSPASTEFRDARGRLQQEIGAKIAIHEGGLVGKGPGKSTQKYSVPIMFEDYMFSFIIEEYGLAGGILVIILYISLLARGSLIARNCDNLFAKTAVAGLVLLITGQALMHIMVNTDIGPHTGQTLPMISYGKWSFLVFSIAFGIILSISRMAKRKMEREAEAATPLGTRSGKIQKDEMESTLDDLDKMESASLEDDLDSLDSFPEHENDIPDYGIDDHNNE